MNHAGTSTPDAWLLRTLHLSSGLYDINLAGHSQRAVCIQIGAPKSLHWGKASDSVGFKGGCDAAGALLDGEFQSAPQLLCARQSLKHKAPPCIVLTG